MYDNTGSLQNGTKETATSSHHRVVFHREDTKKFIEYQLNVIRPLLIFKQLSKHGFHGGHDEGYLFLSWYGKPFRTIKPITNQLARLSFAAIEVVLNWQQLRQFQNSFVNDPSFTDADREIISGYFGHSRHTQQRHYAQKRPAEAVLSRYACIQPPLFTVTKILISQSFFSVCMVVCRLLWQSGNVADTGRSDASRQSSANNEADSRFESILEKYIICSKINK